ncbi:hypothetical protein [Oceanicoccus sagamiensis]|uniref:Uncharacterized protein n=1 Tax=Oceanicoccus sagamiensis TaxID=716816 RepID=A0A1X9NKW0_9GAMM|nr:hypothetical protein [Oceanicoccus sagamiensis]ARN74593.1 hypothetical protein BST96_10950 [Oceanicoccus sagamiensis]
MNNKPPITVIKPWHKIAEEINLPLPTAIWVLGAHAFTLLSPLLLMASVHIYWDYLQQVLYAPELLYLSAIVMMIGSAFEIADNTFDRWYLTGLPPSLCDWLFSCCICLSIALNITAFMGQYTLLVIAAFAAVIGFAVMYLMDWPQEIMRGGLGIVSAFSLYWVVGDPVAFFSFLSAYLTVYFFTILKATHAQSMHGFTTIVNAFGMLCTPWAFYNGAAGNYPIL